VPEQHRQAALYRDSTGFRQRRQQQGGDEMAFALIQDVASTWQQYEWLAAGLYQPPPSGLIIHLAGPTDEGIRVIAVWESEKAWQRFQAERLRPALAALGGPTRPQPTIRRLHTAHLVLGTLPTETEGGTQ
jgi:hypothetical protein